MDRASADKAALGPEPTAGLRRALRSRANRIKARLAAGRRGLEPPFLAQVRQAFDHTDLLKVRIEADTPGESDAMAAALAARVPCHLVARVGRVALLYRPRAESNHE